MRMFSNRGTVLLSVLGSLHRLRRVLELAGGVGGVAHAQVQGHGLALPGEVFNCCRKVTAAGSTGRHVA